MPDDTVDFAPLAQAEEAGKAVQQASERMANFWMGALSPMWVPFWAATSFGISAWSVGQAMSAAKAVGPDGALKPVNFVNPWLPNASALSTVMAETESAIRDTQRAAMKMMIEAEEVAAEAVERMPHVPVKAAFVPQEIATEAAVEAGAEAVKTAPEAMAATMDTAADSLEPLAKPAPKKKRAPKPSADN
ncbi:hypothetical protein [Asticcacaulis machinosus]|uniref:Phasin protein n=1 Tax=Asticcacaulis machinosus TaxID=2984211 RepID=A0ABT5HMF9_9CAUL|nr:hypothetical protein [Asticcacaulis machinosus]MDC7677437.1 hypothetical protein [Asticcacaulis machinosus]